MNVRVVLWERVEVLLAEVMYICSQDFFLSGSPVHELWLRRRSGDSRGEQEKTAITSSSSFPISSYGCQMYDAENRGKRGQITKLCERLHWTLDNRRW